MSDDIARCILDAQAAQLRGMAAQIRAQGMFAANAAAASGHHPSSIPFTWQDFKKEANALEEAAKRLEDTPA